MKTIITKIKKTNHSTYEMITDTARINWNNKRRYSFQTQFKLV